MWIPFTSSPHAFHTGDAPLAKLVKVAAQPELAIHVQHLIIAFGKIPGAEVWRYRDALLKLKEDHLHDAFTSAVDGPIRRHTMAIDLALRAALSALPNLRDVTMYSHSFRYAALHNAQVGAVTRSLLAHFSQASPPRPLRYWTHMASNKDAIIHYSEALPKVLANTSVFEFQIYDDPDSGSSARITLDSVLTDALLRMRILRAFKLVCPYGDDWPDLQRLFSILENVEMETLVVGNFSLIGLPPMPMGPSSSFPSRSPRTRDTLRFFHASISGAWLLHLLNCSSQTLRKVRLEQTYLTSGTWGEVFRFMTHNLPKLDFLILKKIRYAETGSSQNLHPFDGMNDPIINGRGREMMASSELSDFGFLKELLEVVDTRSEWPLNDGNGDSYRPVFGPKEQTSASWHATAPVKAKKNEGDDRCVLRDTRT